MSGRELSMDEWREHRLYDLTPTQMKVLRVVGTGVTNAEIGSALFISHNTVRDHVKKIHDVLDIKGRARLAVWACKHLEEEEAGEDVDNRVAV